MGSVQDLLRIFLSEYGVSLVGMIALVTFITGWLNNILNVNTGRVVWKIVTVGHLISWLVAILASLLVWWVDIGTSMFVGLDVLTVLLYGFLIGLGANAFFSLEIIQIILNAIKGLSPMQQSARLTKGK